MGSTAPQCEIPSVCLGNSAAVENCLAVADPAAADPVYRVPFLLERNQSNVLALAPAEVGENMILGY